MGFSLLEILIIIIILSILTTAVSKISINYIIKAHISEAAIITKRHIDQLFELKAIHGRWPTRYEINRYFNGTSNANLGLTLTGDLGIIDRIIIDNLEAADGQSAGFIFLVIFGDKTIGTPTPLIDGAFALILMPSGHGNDDILLCLQDTVNGERPLDEKYQKILKKSICNGPQFVQI